MSIHNRPFRTKHSIGEWYGQGFDKISPAKRRELACQELDASGLSGKFCPFVQNKECYKKGGVCSLRLYAEADENKVRGLDSPISTCPRRFLENGMIYSWVGEVLLGTPKPLVLSEIGFLEKILPKNSSPSATGKKSRSDFIGRIDNVLLHPNGNPLDWCALEIQAVYFSGAKMDKEFVEIAKREPSEKIPFPVGHRRPDWRSSGPKRLLPQLQTKTPTIRTWGKKVAVVVDEPFFESLVGLERERHLSNAEIVWFVVRYQETPQGWTLIPGEVVYSKLDASVKALTGGVPVSKEIFEKQLLDKISKTYPGHPLAEQC